MALYRFFIQTFFMILLAVTGIAQPSHAILISPVSMLNHKKAAYSDLVIFNEHWDTLQYKKFEGVFLSNFQRWQTAVGIRYTYYMQDTNAFVPKGMNYTSGHIYIADSNFNIIKKIGLLPHGHVYEKAHTADGHDFIYIADDHYITLGYHEKVPNNIPSVLHPAKKISVLSSILQEVKDGKVIWQWDSADYPELYLSSQLNNNFADTLKTQDYLHVNAFFIDTHDNNLIVSCKNSNQILKLNRKNGDIIWRLGGNSSNFSLTKEQQFIHQHHITITKDRTFLFFDNGDDKRPNSRILMFQLDEKAKYITSFRSIPLTNIYTPSAGSVQLIDDHFFISTGTIPLLLEIDLYGNIISEKHLLHSTYRALKY